MIRIYGLLFEIFRWGKNRVYRDMKDLRREIMREIYEKRLFLTWYRDREEGWELFSGFWSPFYLNLRELGSFPDLLRKIGKGLNDLMEEKIVLGRKKSDFGLVGLPTFGVVIGTALSLESGVSLLVGRKVGGDIEGMEEWGYGEHRLVEGRMEEGQEFIFVDDLVTSFGSVERQKELFDVDVKRRGLKEVGLRHGLVLIDREQGGMERARGLGVDYYSLIGFQSEGLGWLKEELSGLEYEVIGEYLEDPGKFQDKGLREKMIGRR